MIVICKPVSPQLGNFCWLNIISNLTIGRTNVYSFSANSMNREMPCLELKTPVNSSVIFNRLYFVAACPSVTVNSLAYLSIFTGDDRTS